MPKIRIVLISCVSVKLPHRALVKDLYISPLFKLNMKYAKKLQPDKIFVLSALYGLLDLEQDIEPYEKTLNKMGVVESREWAARVLSQINEVCEINETEFTFLAGEKYRKYLLPGMPNVHIPLKGLGIGKQLRKLKELTS